LSNQIANAALEGTGAQISTDAISGDDIATYDVSIEKLGAVAAAHGKLKAQIADVSKKSAEFSKILKSTNANKIAKENEAYAKSMKKSSKETKTATGLFGKL